MLSIPVSSLSYGYYKGYDEAFTRSSFNSISLYYSRGTSEVVLGTALAATATTAVFMIIRLVKYIRASR